MKLSKSQSEALAKVVTEQLKKERGKKITLIRKKILASDKLTLLLDLIEDNNKLKAREKEIEKKVIALTGGLNYYYIIPKNKSEAVLRLIEKEVKPLPKQFEVRNIIEVASIESKNLKELTAKAKKEIL